MSEETLTKCKRMAYRLSREELGKLYKYVEKRSKKLWHKAREEEDREHAKRILNLPLGTEVIIKFGKNANQVGTIVKQGRKYTHIKLPDGHWWKYPPNMVDERIDNKSVKHTAEMNAEMMPVLNKIFSDVYANNEGE
jgi:hypothetical protein